MRSVSVTHSCCMANAIAAALRSGTGSASASKFHITVSTAAAEAGTSRSHGWRPPVPVAYVRLYSG